MRQNSLAIVAPYFGTLPAHTQLYLNSLAANPEVTWLLYTDDRTDWDYPANVRVTFCTLEDLRKRFKERLDFEIALPNVKKLGDYKPLYGYLFEEELAGYDAWGHVDVGDVVYGDMSHFITDEMIARYDRLGYLGHLAIYRNTEENNRRFMADSGAGFGYREVFSDPMFYNFEEVAPGSIDAIWRKNGWTTGVLYDHIADLRAMSWAFKVSQGYGTDAYEIFNNKNLVFEWANGRLFGHEAVKGGGISTKEYLYVHFKRRKMPLSKSLNPSRYLIAPDGFLPAPDAIDMACLKRLGHTKFPDPMWVKCKTASLKVRFKR